MHQKKEMSNKLIEKHIFYQDYNKLIINISNESTSNQQIMNTNTGYLSKKNGNDHPHIQWHNTVFPPNLLFISNEQ